MIGNAIREYRKQHKMSQEELAIKLGVTRSSIAGYESNLQIPPLLTALKWSIELGFSLDELARKVAFGEYKSIYEIEQIEKNRKIIERAQERLEKYKGSSK